MKRKRISKWIATGLSIAMMFGIVNFGTTEVMAAENTAPFLAQYVDVNGSSSAFSSFNLNGGTAGKIKFGLNDFEAREWLIAGSDGENTLALFSGSEFGTSSYDDNSSNYGDDSSEPIIESTVLNYLRNTCLGSSYFSSSEKNWMKDTIVTSEDYEKASHAVNAKLYLPDVADRTVEPMEATIIYVGKDNNIPINLYNIVGSIPFWLRSAYGTHESNAYMALSGHYVTASEISSYEYSVRPAFDMNLSSVLFASSAPAASSSLVGDMAVSMVANTFTLRYASTGSESAVVCLDGTGVTVMGATSNMYLVVQNSDGAWRQSVSGNTTVNASEVIINESALTSLENCKVWLESTDTGRITTAKLATQSIESYNATITNPASSHISISTEPGNGIESQTGLSGAMTNVVYTADSGCYFQADYIGNGSMYNNGIIVTRDSSTQITVAGIPIANAEITLLAATVSSVQESSLTITNGVGGTHQLNSDGTITTTCSGDLEDFADIYVDGVLVGGENYTVESGSTIVTLKAEYLDGLPVGTHTLTFLYWTGSAETTFTIVDGKDAVPKTGENMQVVWLFVLMLGTGAGAIYIGRKKKLSRN